jgi:hypothetical protein
LEATLVELILKLVEILTNAVLLRNSAFSFKGMAPPAVKTALYKKEFQNCVYSKKPLSKHAPYLTLMRWWEKLLPQEIAEARAS